MIAPKTLPPAYEAWNARHNAPFGARWWLSLCQRRGGSHMFNRRFKLPVFLMRSVGEFGFQANNTIRTFEYPWCYDVAKCSPGMNVIDVGAGASGLPFVLAQEGVNVTAVDPLPEVPGADQWVFTQRDYAKLNRAFGNKVRYIPKFLEDAALTAAGFDRVFCISVIEHVPPSVVPPLMAEIKRLLKPGGLFVTTIDLFSDVAPFTSKKENAWGTNMDVRWLVECSGLSLVFGKRDELFGFPEFDADKIRARFPEFLHGGVAMSQCIVLRKD